MGHVVRELGPNFPRKTLKEVRDYMEHLRLPTIRGSGGIEFPEPPSTQDAVAAYLTRMEDTGAANGYLKVRARKLRFFARQYPELPTSPEPIRA
ncbi:unnamed protein product, partial [marine sediment metagenome]